MNVYHYPPDLLSLMIEAIPLLCRTKRDVFTFLHGAGVGTEHTAALFERFKSDRNSVTKYEIVRVVLERINQTGDSDLVARRNVLRRVLEFEDFSICWPNDQYKAMGLVEAIRKLRNVKDNFTRMSNEREKERKLRQEEYEQNAAKSRQRQEEIERVKRDFYGLFSESNSQKRGKALESVLNNLFRVHGILIREDFCRKGDGVGTIEQIDGAIEFESRIFLVEMKWHAEKLGVGDVSQHLCRLFLRPDIGGIFISNLGYADTALQTVRDALSQRVVFCITLEEIVHALDTTSDFIEILKTKLRAALVDKNPFLEMKSGR